MKVDLTSEERLMLLHLIKAALAETKYPLSPKLTALRRLAAKLSDEKYRLT
jgi:hypothetical protein